MCPTPMCSIGRLFNDATAEPGQSYCYRVVARNASGESEPSNVVGPVTVRAAHSSTNAAT